MQSTFNASIAVQGRVTGADDADGNKTYTYSNILADERCRTYISTKSKLTDDKNWITFKIRKFLIKDIYTSLVDATHILYDSKYFKIEKIEESDSFSRMKHRIIETEYKEGKG